MELISKHYLISIFDYLMSLGITIILLFDFHPSYKYSLRFFSYCSLPYDSMYIKAHKENGRPRLPPPPRREVWTGGITTSAVSIQPAPPQLHKLLIKMLIVMQTFKRKQEPRRDGNTFTGKIINREMTN